MKNLVNIERKKLDNLPDHQSFHWKVTSKYKIIHDYPRHYYKGRRINYNHIKGIINKNIDKDWNEVFPLIIKILPKHESPNRILNWIGLSRFAYDYRCQEYREINYTGGLGYTLNDCIDIHKVKYHGSYYFIDPINNSINKYSKKKKESNQQKDKIKKHYEFLSKSKKIDRNSKKLNKEKPVHTIYDPRDLGNYDYVIKFIPQIKWYSTYEQKVKDKEDVTLYYEDKMIQKEDLRLNQNNDVEVYTKFSINKSYIKGRENIIKFCKEHNKSIIFIPKPLEYIKFGERYW